MNLKNILTGALLPLLSLAAPKIAHLVSDLEAALADGHLSNDEIIKLVNDFIDAAKTYWAEGAPALDALQVNLTVDLPNIAKTFESFSALSKK